MRWLTALFALYMFFGGLYTVMRPTRFSHAIERYRSKLGFSDTEQIGFARFAGVIGCFIGLAILGGLVLNASWV
jgi:hypothetical protein